MSAKKFVVVNTVRRNKPPPISPDLTLSDQLLEVLESTPADMSNDKKTIEIIQFVKASLVRCGHDPSRVFTGGYQQEALIAAVLGKKPNKKAHGYDLTDENGVHTEIKTTNTALGKTANVNFAPARPTMAGARRALSPCCVSNVSSARRGERRGARRESRRRQCGRS